MADFANIDKIQFCLLEEVADLHEVPAGAFNIRANGQLAQRVSSAKETTRMWSLWQAAESTTAATRIPSTTVDLAAGAKLVIRERLLTHGTQYAESEFVVRVPWQAGGSFFNEG